MFELTAKTQSLLDSFQYNAFIAFPSGQVFFGFRLGKTGQTMGEICFNTSMTGYQEILTDPSYHKQIITFTFPHIGNVGANNQDVESARIYASGCILREVPTQDSNFRARQSFSQYLAQNGITGIYGVDTRKLTQKIRTEGATNIVVQSFDCHKEINTKSINKAIEIARNAPSMQGAELAKDVSCKQPYIWQEQSNYLDAGKILAKNRATQDKIQGNREGKTQGKIGLRKLAVLDFGVKYNILRMFASVGFQLTIYPAATSAKTILADKPDGIFLSNGPGDPKATAEYAIPTIKELIKSNKPIFGICLGHQLLCLALGLNTAKMPQGHRGANHPVQNLATGKVEITSQNHGFVVSEPANTEPAIIKPRGDDNDNDMDAGAENIIITHRSLFDGTIEGIAVKGKPVFSVQHHPEASPGPRDSFYLFTEFLKSVKLPS